MIKHNRHGGYSLVEALMYVALVAMLVGVITYAIKALFVANAVVRSTRNVENSAIGVTDRMIREIRAASSVDLAGSSFNVDNGILSLFIPSGASTRSVRFFLSDSQVMVEDNGSLTGPLTLSATRATSMRFSYLATTTSTAVKFEIVLAGPESNPGVSEKFFGTAVLRGSYIQ